MVTGREAQLTKQTGEFLVCSELCRRGLISTSFNGNVPEFDILSIDDNFVTRPIQVKTIRRGNWQFDAERFINISKVGKRPNIKQDVIGLKKLPDENLIYIFVNLISYGKDEFFIIKSLDLQKIMYTKYKERLAKFDGIRPKESESTHISINQDDIVDYKDNWRIIAK